MVAQYRGQLLTSIAVQMSHTAHRLLRLIALLQARQNWSGGELAKRMQVDRRSVRRDIQRLRELGYPVRASSGVGGGYRMGAGGPLLPLLLEEEEATAIALALRAAASSMAGLEDTARSVLTKLDPLVPSRRRQQAGEIHAATATLSQKPSVDGQLLGKLAVACRQAAPLAFDYLSHGGAATHRRVDAQHLVNYGRCWYLLAWDHGRADWRTLRVDRISGLQALPGQGMRRALSVPPEVAVHQAVSQAPFVLKAEVHLPGSLQQLAPQVPPWCGVLQEGGPEHCILHVGADTPAMLASQILSLGIRPLRIETTPAALRAEMVACLDGLAAVMADAGSSRPV